MKIYAGPVFIDFGPVFVKSTISKTFTIRNDLRTAISCRLIVLSFLIINSMQISHKITNKYIKFIFNVILIG